MTKNDPRKDELKKRKKALTQLVGANLRRLRVARGLPQEVLADEAEMSTANLSRIERGLYNPTAFVIDQLAKALDAKHTEFFRPLKPGSKPIPTLKAGRKKAGR